MELGYEEEGTATAVEVMFQLGLLSLFGEVRMRSNRFAHVLHFHLLVAASLRQNLNQPPWDPLHLSTNWWLLEKPVSNLSFGELVAFKKPVCWVAALEPMKMEQYRETFW